MLLIIRYNHILKKIINLKSGSRFGSYRPPGGHWTDKKIKYLFLRVRGKLIFTKYAIYRLLIHNLKKN